MIQAPRNVSIWLLPSADSPENATMQQTITRLANETSKPTYLPHITLAQLPVETSASEAEVILRGMIDRGELMGLRIRHRVVTVEPRAILLEGFQSPALMEAKRIFHEEIGGRDIVKWFPHVSLAYMDDGQQEAVDRLLEEGTLEILPNGEGVRIGGYKEFVVGRVMGWYCGNLDVKNWRQFLDIQGVGNERNIHPDL